ncbi:MAG TPA: biosynthetic peptidoglycan transglycosylase [Candidatus Limnocylindrales bacterium]|nr:biosynthetic peptidoglycan transglycosylase [Candidatus Limnocylindrales bacterium]
MRWVRSKKPRIVLRFAGRLLGIGVAGGLVVALVVFPIVLLTGVTLKHGSGAFLGMPARFTEPEVGQTSYVYAADGKTLLTMFYEEHRRHLKLAEIPPQMYQAVVAAEDSRFYEHKGVDVKGLARAFVANQHAGGVEQGASTLTMQYVRMALRDGARTPNEVVEATERTPSRKIREARIAIELEKRLSKDDILERYLNFAYSAQRLRRSHPGHRQRWILLRLRQALVDATAAVRGQPAAAPGQPAPRRPQDSHYHRSEAAGHRRQGGPGQTAAQQRFRSRTRGGRTRYRICQSHGGQPHLLR